MEKLTTEKFVAAAKATHGENRYDYSSTVYNGASTKVTIRCKVHGGFEMLPSMHSTRGQGCPSCAKTKRRRSRIVKREEFVARALAVHGQRYNYERLPSRPSATEKVDIVCELHGVFKQSLHDHEKGTGCPGCMTSGFRKSLPGFVYVLASDCLTKVGVTNRHPVVRARELTRRSRKDFEIVASKFFADGADALEVERQLLRFLRANSQQVTEVYEGSTETFIGVDRFRLLRFLSKR